MRIDSVENKILRGEYPSKDSFEQYYIIENHSQNETAEHFHITRSSVQSLVSFWRITKDERSVACLVANKAKQCSRSTLSKIESGTYPVKDIFYEYYITNNNSRKDTAKHFNISEAAVISLCSLWDIHKTKKEIADTKKQTCRLRYGCDSNLQTSETKAKIKQTCLLKYGVESASQSQLSRDKRRQTFVKKYGVEHVLQNDAVKQRLQNTVKNRYGVDWACQLEECRKSSNGNNSGPNKHFEQLLAFFKVSATREYPISKYNFDFKIGTIVIEIDPWFTHQSSFSTKFCKKSKDYHSGKTLIASQNGYHCIHIFDWDDQNKIVKIFLLPKEKCYARNCDIRTVSIEEEQTFLNENHLQGYVKSDICLGLYYNDQLVQLMSFGKPRYNKNYSYELLRLCSTHSVTGGAQKLFKFFVDQYKPTNIISYCDLSKFDGTVYNNLGFKLLRKSIGKHWYSPKLKKHITDNLLRQQGFDRLLGDIFGTFGKGSCNEELMLTHGFVEIYDAGQATYIFTKSDC